MSLRNTDRYSATGIRKKKRTALVMLTAYDYPTAQFVEQGGADIILVGDSLGMVVLGFESTRHVTLDMMLHHTAAARRGAPGTHLVGDMPHRSYDTPESALENARRLVEVGADSVKVEGAVTDVVRALRGGEIEVMGHIGLLPQTATDHKARGRTPEEAQKTLDEAKALEDSGCYSIVLEHMPLSLGERITESLGIPTIGIGAGPHCDGQVLVLHDMLGMFDAFTPPFVKRYGELGAAAKEAVRAYAAEVRAGTFPDEAHSTK